MSEQQVLPEFIATLKATAEKATPGPWQAVETQGVMNFPIIAIEECVSGKYLTVCEISNSMKAAKEIPADTIDANGAYISAASPENILKLIASLAQSEAERERLQAHYESQPYMTSQPFSDDTVRSYADLDDEALKEFEEFAENCKCQRCGFVSHVLQLRAELARGGERNQDGSWPKHSLQRAFVDGMKWWQFHHNGSTAFPSERDEAETEALRRYGEPQPAPVVTGEK